MSSSLYSASQTHERNDITDGDLSTPIATLLLLVFLFSEPSAPRDDKIGTSLRAVIILSTSTGIESVVSESVVCERDGVGFDALEWRICLAHTFCLTIRACLIGTVDRLRYRDRVSRCGHSGDNSCSRR